MKVILLDGLKYLPIRSECIQYHKFKPSFLQRLVHIVWPLPLIKKWEMYKILKEDDCFNDI